MSSGTRRRSLPRLGPLALLVLAACAGQPATPVQPAPALQQGQPPLPARVKAITIGLSVPVETIGILSHSAPTGGWIQVTELHADGLITADSHTRRPIGRLASNVPSLADGTMSVLPDGRMRVAFTIRKGVTWHDGTHFTVEDLVFSYAFCCDPGVPNGFQQVAQFMSSVEAVDDSTFAVYYRGPNFQGANLGPHAFWPLPRHLLQAPYERYLADRTSAEMLNLPYWNAMYVHLGPFRLARFDPGEGMAFEAYDRYFLGRPKIDTVHVRFFSDQTTLFANVVAGVVDVVPAVALVSDVGVEFKRRWDSSGEGTVYVRPSSVRLLEYQTRRALVGEPALHERGVRAALLHAMDREAISEAMNGGPRLPAWALLLSDEPGYQGTRDSLRVFSYDPERARALLRESGWSPGAGGTLRHESDGRPLRTAIWGSPGRDKEAASFASYWRQVGIDVEEFMVPPVRNADREFRSQFPGWAMTGESPLSVMSLPATSAQNRWRGNFGGFEDPVAQRLVAAYQTSLAPHEQAEAMRAVSDYVVRELPFLPTFYLVQWIGARKGIKAFDDIEGSEGSERLWGGYARNAHLWDLE